MKSSLPNFLFYAITSCLLVTGYTLSPTSMPSSQNQPSNFPTADSSRRGLLRASVSAVAALTAANLFPSSAHAGDASAFVGTYSDPINHPGGTRTIKLLEGKSVGGYQLAEVQGGGGVGEPKNYVLPAVIFDDRAIVIDFSPKGGPRDFTGILVGNDIKFLRDGNKWPRLN